MPISEKQKQILAFTYTDYDALICDGAIRSGKTVFMMMAFIDDSMRRYNNQRFGICGKTVDSTVKNIIVPFMELTCTKKKYQIKWKRSDKLLIVKNGNRVNTFEVFGGKDESSFALIQGRTFAGVLFDEVVLQPESFVNQALARCSVEGARSWFNCNPGSPEHWFYKNWVCQLEKHNAYRIHFQLEDNPSLSEKTIQKYHTDYSGVFFQRYVLGLWVVAEGLVYDFKEEYITDEVPESGEYYVSIDYGTFNAFSAGLWCVRGAQAVRIKEYYYSGREQKVQLTDDQYCQAMVEFTKGYDIERFVVDPSASSFIVAMKKDYGFRVRHANNDVLDGINRTARYLKKGNIKIHRSCGDAIREFGLYRWDDKATEDVVVKENDHSMDEIRYFCNTIMKKKVNEDRYYKE